MQLVSDGRHSVPTTMDLSVDGGATKPLDLGHVGTGTGRARGATTTADVRTGPVTGTTFRFTITSVDAVRSLDWFSHKPTVVPVGIAELGLPVTRPEPAPDSAIPATCRTDLATAGDTVVPMKLVATADQVLSRDPGRLESCGAPLALPSGRTLLRTSEGRLSGIDVDLLALASSSGGGPGVDTLATPPPAAPAAPKTTTTTTGRLTSDVAVTNAQDPYWVVLGQSHNDGWHATLNGKDLGPPTLINGFANGWRIDPATAGADATIHLEWTPQKLVLYGLIASALGVLVCLILLFWPLRLWAGRPVDEDRVGDLEVGSVGLFGGDNGPVTARTTVVATLIVAIATYLFMGPWVALGVAVTTAVALAVRRGQVALRVVCFGLIAAASAFVVLKQARNDYFLDFDWMNHFELVHAWGLAAIALLAVDPLVESLRRRRGRNRD